MIHSLVTGNTYMSDILAGIVLYNSEISRLANELRSINTQVSYICLFDNGSSNYVDILQMVNSLSFRNRITILQSPKNNGIGYALNRIFEFAKQNHFSWVLTLDHDTICPPNILEEYSKHLSIPKLGILCPRVVDNDIVKNMWDSGSTEEIEKIDRCIQSGTLVNIEIWEKVQKFDEWMFIDFVDFDFCEKLVINQYSIYRCNKVIIDHELGKRCKTKIAPVVETIYKFTKIKSFKYLMYKNVFSSARIYYCARNNVVYIRKYAKYIDVRKEKLQMYRRMMKRILRGKNRWMILKETIKGIKAGNREEVETYQIR